VPPPPAVPPVRRRAPAGVRSQALATRLPRTDRSSRLRNVDLPTRDSERAGPVGRTAAPCVRPACLTKNDRMYLRPKPGQSLDLRNLLTLSGDDCDVSRQSSPVAQARAPGPPSLARAKPVSRATARQARTQTRTLWPSTWLLLKAMGAGPAGRIAYAAASRLDGIGRRAIGDMVSSAVASS
jgi:hypothetical protein